MRWWPETSRVTGLAIAPVLVSILSRSEEQGQLGNLRLAAGPICRIAGHTDAHQIDDLDSLELGTGIARKGWLTPEDVINTMTADEMLAWAKARR